MFLVMGIVALLLRASTRCTRTGATVRVLFWKSLPLSDAETVLSKFAVAVDRDPARCARPATRGGAAAGRGRRRPREARDRRASTAAFLCGSPRRCSAACGVAFALVRDGDPVVRAVRRLPDAGLGLGAARPLPLGRAAAGRGYGARARRHAARRTSATSSPTACSALYSLRVRRDGRTGEAGDGRGHRRTPRQAWTSYGRLCATSTRHPTSGSASSPPRCCSPPRCGSAATATRRAEPPVHPTEYRR